MIEGVIQFRAKHTKLHLKKTSFSDALDDLAAWREIFCALEVIGQEETRYEGAGFGNLSIRAGPFPGAKGARPFLITGTQTGGEPCISLADFALVRRYDMTKNEVESEGERLPSSESMTHGALYDVSPSIRCIIHVHAPILFDEASALGLPVTDPAVGYGTPEMAQAVSRLWRTTRLEHMGVLVMGGHEDGVIGFGRSVAEAGHRLLDALVRALVIRKKDERELCSGAIIRKVASNE